MLQNANELLHAGETAVLVFTKGQHLELDWAGGESATGWWRMSAARNPDKVIVYKSNPLRTGGEIYIGDYVGKRQRELDGRFNIYFRHVQFVGECNVSWSEFANKGKMLQSPVRYLSI